MDYIFLPSNPSEISNCPNNYFLFFLRWKPNNTFQNVLLLISFVWGGGRGECCSLGDFDLSSFLSCKINNTFLFTWETLTEKEIKYCLKSIIFCINTFKFTRSIIWSMPMCDPTLFRWDLSFIVDLDSPGLDSSGRSRICFNLSINNVSNQLWQGQQNTTTYKSLMTLLKYSSNIRQEWVGENLGLRNTVRLVSNREIWI